MEDGEQTHVKFRHSRTPKTVHKVKDNALRQSLLSDSTSGIDNDEEDDTTSVGSNSFSSGDIDVSKNEHNLTVMFQHEDEQKSLTGVTKGSQELKPILKVGAVQIIDNPSEEIIDGGILSSTTKSKIPDGGWGWMVVLSSFIISMIADGISFSFGLLYIEFLEEFQASKSTTAWIGSLFIAVPLLSGPVMSALVDRYGIRSMTILGGIISTLGFVLASVSTSLEMMMITFGVIAGLGLGLVYVTAVVSIAFWFEKKRNLAMGLGACGTGVGTFVYAPMTQYFIEEYGWRGTILLLSGTLLNLCVCGCVMRNPEWMIEEDREEKMKSEKSRKEESKSTSSASVSNPYAFDFDAPTRGKSMKGLIQRGMSPERVIKNEAASIRRHQNMLIFKKKYYNRKLRSESMVNIPTYLTYNDKTSMQMLDSLVEVTNKEYDFEVKYPTFVTDENEPEKNPLLTKKSNDPPIVTHPKNILQRTHSDKYDVRKEKTLGDYQLKNETSRRFVRKTKSEEAKDAIELVKQDSKENRRDWLKKQLSVNHHYLKDLKMPINSISHRNAMLNIKKYRLKASSCPDIFKNSMITINEKEEKWYDECLICLSDMFNVSLMKKPTFNLLCFGTIILFVWFIVPYFYLAEHMLLNGYTEDDGAVMLSLIGIANTIGMVGFGWIGDFPQVSIGYLYSVCLMLCGSSVAAIPVFITNYWVLASMSFAFGILFAASYTFTPSLLVTLVSLDDFTSAYGLVLLAQGIGHLIGPPLSGMIFDVTLSWSLSFYLAGGWIIVSGVLIWFIQPVKDYQRKHAEDSRSDSSMA